MSWSASRAKRGQGTLESYMQKWDPDSGNWQSSLVEMLRDLRAFAQSHPVMDFYSAVREAEKAEKWNEILP